MILTPYNASLNNILEKDANFLPLSRADETRLMELIPEDDGIYLTLKDNLYTEYVYVENQCGTLVVTRGVDSDAKRFPRGTCVFFETSLPVIKWLICNHQCCDGPCPCEAVTVAGVVSPPALVGHSWDGSAIFKGDTPMVFGVTGMPSWMTADWSANHVHLTGTPTAPGLWTVSIAATNCNGDGVAVQTLTVAVTT